MIRSLVGGIYYGNYLASIVVVDSLLISCSMLKRKVVDYTDMVLFSLSLLSTQLVYVSGTLKVSKDEPFIACIVHPVSPPSILELRMEGNMFVTHYAMDMTCLFFDGR